MKTTQTEIDPADGLAPVGIYPGAEATLDRLPDRAVADTPGAPGRVYRSPKISRWPFVGLVLWAGLPTFLVAPTVWFSHMVWPGPLDAAFEWARALGLYGAPVILFAWSVVLLRRRREKHWIIKAVPLTVSMLVVNATIVFGPMRMGGGGGRGFGGFGGMGDETPPHETQEFFASSVERAPGDPGPGPIRPR